MVERSNDYLVGCLAGLFDVVRFAERIEEDANLRHRSSPIADYRDVCDLKTAPGVLVWHEAVDGAAEPLDSSIRYDRFNGASK